MQQGRDGLIEYYGKFYYSQYCLSIALSYILEKLFYIIQGIYQSIGHSIDVKLEHWGLFLKSSTIESPPEPSPGNFLYVKYATRPNSSPDLQVHASVNS